MTRRRRVAALARLRGEADKLESSWGWELFNEVKNYLKLAANDPDSIENRWVGTGVYTVERRVGLAGGFATIRDENDFGAWFRHIKPGSKIVNKGEVISMESADAYDH